MNMIFEQLPKAMRWSGVLGIIFLICSVLQLIATVFVGMGNVMATIVPLILLAMCVVLYLLCRNYKQACQAALVSQSDDDLEEAIRKQSALIKFFGIFSLIMLIFILIGLFGLMAAFTEYVRSAAR